MTPARGVAVLPSATLNNSPDEGRLPDVLEIVLYHAHEPDTQGHRRVPPSVDDSVEVVVAESVHESESVLMHFVVIVEKLSGVAPHHSHLFGVVSVAGVGDFER